MDCIKLHVKKTNLSCLWINIFRQMWFFVIPFILSGWDSDIKLCIVATCRPWKFPGSWKIPGGPCITSHGQCRDVCLRKKWFPPAIAITKKWSQLRDLVIDYEICSKLWKSVKLFNTVQGFQNTNFQICTWGSSNSFTECTTREQICFEVYVALYQRIRDISNMNMGIED